MRRILWLIVLAAGCGGQAAAPTSPPPPPVLRLFATNLEGIDAFVVNDDASLSGQQRLSPTRGISVSSVVAGDGRYLYVANVNGLEGYRIDPATGALSPLPGSPFSTERGGLIADPLGRFVFHFGSGAAVVTLTAYRIDAATGALSRAGVSSLPPALARVEPQGRFAFFTVLQNLWVYRIDDSGTWTAIPGAPYALPPEGANASRFVFGRTGSSLYIGAQGTIDRLTHILAYRFDPTTGTPTLVAPQKAPEGRTMSSMAVSPDGGILYVAMRNTTNTDTQPPAVYAYRIDASSGALAEAANLTVPARMPVFSAELALSLDGRVLFMTLEPTPFVLPLAPADLAVLRVDGASMALAPGSPYGVGSDPHTLHVFKTQPPAR